jgi:hypothetical protein
MSDNLPATREPLTLFEAQRVGAEANKLVQLRDMLDASVAASLTVDLSKGNGTVTLPLTSDEREGVLSLLMERSGVFLSSFGVDLAEVLP